MESNGKGGSGVEIRVGLVWWAALGLSFQFKAH